ncbi:TetR/AcrR family transcriptional regulator [Spongiactinospora sp. TRM90649]|uniref:TetR/AcrR family transcriptional regulator n=1 Tax=Spongiactinospora sp. TRM90649 TaxID=3031114 RepID=UPI0023F9AB2D|nr:TetR/AcrR family transcriptional regulator [Spongiactinospora sp. TRM90649]MDF5752158.1 TetR/AcrR family transcriptional regulator [Spongiactinospora sp. TRM90649]
MQGDETASDWRRREPLELPPLLAGALESFYEKGYHGASVRDIASRVGVTVPALYYHYASKQAIMVALVELAARDFADFVTRALRSTPDDPASRLAVLVEAIALQMTQRHRLAFLDAELRYLDPEALAGYRRHRRRVEDELVGVLRSGAEAGVFEVDEVTEVARAILGMCQAIATWYHPGGALSPAEVSGHYARYAMNLARAGVTTAR